MIEALGRTMPVTITPGSIKICGLREPGHAVAAAEAGADLLGFIFAPSRRYVTPASAQRAIVAARAVVDRPVLAVGVFVNASPDEINRVADEAGLDIVQLSGDEPPDVLSFLNLPVIRAIRPAPGSVAAHVLTGIGMGQRRAPVAYLLDGYHAGQFGGTGTPADWSLAAEIATDLPLLLAGGLNPANVATAIGRVGPLGVDVSSGVERDGVKDPGLIAEFVHVAREGFRALSVRRSVAAPT